MAFGFFEGKSNFFKCIFATIQGGQLEERKIPSNRRQFRLKVDIDGEQVRLGGWVEGWECNWPPLGRLVRIGAALFGRPNNQPTNPPTCLEQTHGHILYNRFKWWYHQNEKVTSGSGWETQGVSYVAFWCQLEMSVKNPNYLPQPMIIFGLVLVKRTQWE